MCVWCPSLYCAHTLVFKRIGKTFVHQCQAFYSRRCSYISVKLFIHAGARRLVPRNAHLLFLSNFLVRLPAKLELWGDACCPYISGVVVVCVCVCVYVYVCV